MEKISSKSEKSEDFARFLMKNRPVSSALYTT
jgi:hypothetical protein